MLRIVGVVSLFLGAVVCGLAQGVPSMVSTSANDGGKAFVLTSVDIDVRIHGPLSETSMTLIFHNPHDRVLEGELDFPLPEGATVSGYALDIGGTLRDGVVVDKTKARQVFEEIIRGKKDPGLVEKTRGNSFRTRVFPMPAKGERRIKVSYVSELGRSRAGAVYHLPLTYNTPMKSFALRMEVIFPGDEPIVGKTELTNFEFEEWHSGFFAEVEKTNITLTKDLRVAVPKSKGQMVYTERTPEGDVYFLVQDDAARPDRRTNGAESSDITVLWDTSASNSGRDYTREFNLLRSYFMSRTFPATVTVIGFSIDTKVLGTFTIGPEGCEELIDALKSVTYDGGTSLSALETLLAQPKLTDMYMMFSDGLHTFGHKLKTVFPRPVFAFCNSNTADHMALKRLTLESGGGYFNLKNYKDTAIIPLIGKESYRFLGARFQKNSSIEYYPSLPVPITKGFLMAGKLNGNDAAFKVTYGKRAFSKQIHSFTATAKNAVEGTLLQRYWAQSKINELTLYRPKGVKQKIADIGMTYGIVTEGTSLLVLETLEQYIQYDIMPPKSLPEFRAAFLAKQQKETASLEEQRKSRIDQLLAKWKEKVAWWDITYTYRKIKPVKPKGHVDGAEVLEEEIIEEVVSGSPLQFSSVMGGRSSAGRARAVGRYGGSSRDAGSAPAVQEPQNTMSMALDPEAQEKPIKLKLAEVKNSEAYMKTLNAAPKGQIYTAYLALRKDYKTASAFYLDSADVLMRKGNQALGLKVLSNICELKLDNPMLLRIVGRKLEEVGELDLAIATYEQVKELRPDEPQSLRDLALALELRSLKAKQPAGPDAVAAIALMNDLITKKLSRFNEIKPIVLVELNRMVVRAKNAGLNAVPVDSRFLNPMTPDIRVVLNWDEDNTDMDLWVIEPTEQKCFYGFKKTRIGGLMSHDFTRGYGPEEYMLRKAIPGTYQVKVNYYGSRSSKLTGAITLKLDIYRNYGLPNEQKQTVIRRLNGPKEVIDVCEFSLEGERVDVVVEETKEIAKKPATDTSATDTRW